MIVKVVEVGHNLYSFLLAVFIMMSSNITDEGVDYVPGPHTVLFDDLGIALPTMLCTNISTLEDDDVEGPQTFTIQITSVSLPTSVTIASPSQQSGTISDNDGKIQHSVWLLATCI